MVCDFFSTSHDVDDWLLFLPKSVTMSSRWKVLEGFWVDWCAGGSWLPVSMFEHVWTFQGVFLDDMTRLYTMDISQTQSKLGCLTETSFCFSRGPYYSLTISWRLRYRASILDRGAEVCEASACREIVSGEGEGRWQKAEPQQQSEMVSWCVSVFPYRWAWIRAGIQVLVRSTVLPSQLAAGDWDPKWCSNKKRYGDTLR